jgi:hypothetical protein
MPGITARSLNKYLLPSTEIDTCQMVDLRFDTKRMKRWCTYHPQLVLRCAKPNVIAANRAPNLDLSQIDPNIVLIA